MGAAAIRIQGLWKSYEIGAVQRPRSQTLYDVLAAALRAPCSKSRGDDAPAQTDTFWALRDVEFEIPHGQVVGVIGRNGAGKSTLLKILSRITAPTRGRVEVQGRIASLLEVGTGFHPELSGRENIFVNGAILGMTRGEVSRKFDEIVDFAEIEKFLDTPVKRYSSGMYVRLAFAVAAHLEPDIMVVDEVLAVGDAQFQKKCLAKIENVAGHGRTVLFVSHNMAAIQALCPTAILLEKGSVDHYGPTAQTVARYAAYGQGPATQVWEAASTKTRTALAITRVQCRLSGHQPDLRLQLRIGMESTAGHKPAFVAIDILDSLGVSFMQALPRLEGFVRAEQKTHDVEVEVQLPGLIPGTYYLTVWTGSHNTETLDIVPGAVCFDVTESPSAGRVYPHSPDHGYIVPASVVLEDSSQP
ncbi:MAG: polysaccharide ABC transporter ATP-binding protein [Pseudomonadota bacterium]